MGEGTSTDMSQSGNINISVLDEATKQAIENKIEEQYEEQVFEVYNEETRETETVKWTREEGGRYKYLVHGATLACQFGSHPRKLRVPISHGDSFAVNSKLAIAHDHDCIVGDDENIVTFGICSSENHPKTERFLDGFFQKKIILEVDDGKGGTKNLKGFACTPIIVDVWQNPYVKTKIKDKDIEYPTITVGSFLVCKYAGLIEPFDSGQEEGSSS